MELLERIRKLHALSQRNDSTEEAAAAAAKIQELCFRHNLDLETALASGAETERQPYTKFDYLLPNTSRADVGWKRSLFNSVCKANFCKAVYIPATTRMAVIGQRCNFEVVTYEYDYLVKEIQRLALAACIKQAFLSSKNKRQYMHGFCEGAAATLYHRLSAAHTYQTQQSADGRALVVVKDKELDRATREHFPTLRTATRRATGSNDGYSHGRQAGNNITVNRGVGSRPAGLLN